MPAIGWFFLFLALCLIIGSLIILRNNANSMPISEEKMEKIRKRKAELEAQEQAEGEDK